jgi:gas vesicle protein
MTDYERFGEYQPSEERGRFGTALTFLFIGLGIGAVSALLFAPKTGRQTRRILKRKFEDARETFDDLTDNAEEWVGKGTKWAKKGGEWAKDAGDKVASVRRVIR